MLRNLLQITTILFLVISNNSVFAQTPESFIKDITTKASSILKKECGYLANSLKNFKYQKNLAYLHLDHTLMPKNKLLWSSWNYSTNSEKNISCITYWMNKLQRLNTKNNIFVTLNPINIPEENKIIKVFKYEHPVFDQKAFKVQKIISDYEILIN